MSIPFFHHELQFSVIVIDHTWVIHGMVNVEYSVEHPFLTTVFERLFLVVRLTVIVPPQEDQGKNHDDDCNNCNEERCIQRLIRFSVNGDVLELHIVRPL